jgi:hypothetical protein
MPCEHLLMQADGELPMSPPPSDFAAAAGSVALGFDGTLR